MANSKSNPGLNIIVWIAQVAVAAVFILAGYMKLFTPIQELSSSIPWVEDVPAIFVRFFGLVDLIGGAGVLLPSLFKTKPHYAYCAAWSLCFVMGLAAVFHLFRLEFDGILVNLVLFGLLFFVGWGRHKKVPVGVASSLH